MRGNHPHSKGSSQVATQLSPSAFLQVTDDRSLEAFPRAIRDLEALRRDLARSFWQPEVPAAGVAQASPLGLEIDVSTAGCVDSVKISEDAFGR